MKAIRIFGSNDISLCDIDIPVPDLDEVLCKMNMLWYMWYRLFNIYRRIFICKKRVNKIPNEKKQV